MKQYATSRMVPGSIPDEVNGFFNCPNLSIRTVALGKLKASNKNEYQELPRGKGRPVRKAVNLAAICEPIV
jgi:hypothetical protein